MPTPDICTRCPDKICKRIPGKPYVRVLISTGGPDPGAPETRAVPIEHCPGPEKRKIVKPNLQLAVTD